MRSKTKEIIGDALALVVLGTIIGFTLWRFYYAG
jgi:hypothetical protein